MLFITVIWHYIFAYPWNVSPKIYYCNLNCSSTLYENTVKIVYLSTDLFLPPVIFTILHSQISWFCVCFFFFFLDSYKYSNRIAKCVTRLLVSVVIKPFYHEQNNDIISHVISLMMNDAKGENDSVELLDLHLNVHEESK